MGEKKGYGCEDETHHFLYAVSYAISNASSQMTRVMRKFRKTNRFVVSSVTRLFASLKPTNSRLTAYLKQELTFYLFNSEK